MRRNILRLSRRDMLKIASGSVGYLAVEGLGGTPAGASGITATENAKPGTTAWQLTNPASFRQIEGYASLTSVNRGGQIAFYVHTTEPTYTIEVFRMGWYGGTGGRRVHGPISRPGTAQPMPQAAAGTGLIECVWGDPYVLNVPGNPSDPTDWASGIYLAKLTAGSSGTQAYIMFVVRDDARSSDLLFQSSVTSFQAYNTWGGKCLYEYLSVGGRSRKVSFNRPYGLTSYGMDAGIGAAEFLVGGKDGAVPAGWEYCFLRWLEREGYDVTYCTNIDTHASPNLLIPHRAFLSVGHDEYWSWEMRQNVTAARDQGVNIGFFTANCCYWQVRLEPSPANGAANRTLVCYKYTPQDYLGTDTEDPLYRDGNPSNDHLISVRWRDSLPGSSRVARPEEQLLGTQYRLFADNAFGDIVIANASHWVFNNTGLVNGSRLTGLLGYEGDQMHGSSPPGTELLARSPWDVYEGTYADMTMYTAPSGAIVFAAASMQWPWGLDNYGSPTHRSARLNTAAQQITRNLLARFNSAGNRAPVANPGGPYAAEPGVNIQFNGTGSSDPDGTIVSYQWNFGDGGTATGPTPTRAYAANGDYTVILTVTDNLGASASASTTATIRDGRPTANPGGPYAGIAGKSIQFNGTGSTDPDGTIVGYQWAFGDGGSASGATPTHVYANPGSYTVSLTVTDNSGKTHTATTSAAIGSGAPTANAGGPYTGLPGQPIQFNGTGSTDPDGTIVGYQWAFGDGGTATGATPAHTYAGEGSYTVTLTVTDNDGKTGSATASVSVTSATKGINLGGVSVTIEGNSWLSYTAALAAGLSVSGGSSYNDVFSAAISPPVDADTKKMLESGLWSTGSAITLNQSLTNGNYEVYLWVMEDWQSNYRNMNVKVEGVTVATGIGDLAKGAWKKYGPYAAAVTDGALTIEILRGTKGDPQVNGVAIFAAGPAANTFTISGVVTAGGSPLAGATVTAGAASAQTAADGSYTLSGLAEGTHTVQASKTGYVMSAPQTVTVGPNRTGINFTGTLQVYSISGQVTSGGAPLAGVTITAGSHTATTASDGTYVLTNVPAGTYTVSASRVGYSFSAPQSVTVGPDRSGVNFTGTQGGTTFLKGINLGGVAVNIEGNAWLSHSAALGAGMSVSGGSSYNDPFSGTINPSVDADTKKMLESGLWAAGSSMTIAQTVPNGSYQVYLWILEDWKNNFRNMNVKIEGVTVATGIGDLAKGAWKKYGPYTATVSDGALTIEVLRGTKGDPQVCGVAIFSTG